jgi:O-antigen/teichoic acid export membrane protein/tRNA A-37 threonylcarbamoyl transferase component Bud32
MKHVYSFLEGQRLDPLWAQKRDLVSLQQTLAVADRVVVSGTWFFSTILIARYSDAGQLGVYAVGISVLMSLVALQDSLIWQPNTIQRHSAREISADRAGASLILSLLFSAATILLLTIGALGFLKWRGSLEIVVMTFAMAGALPFVLMREFARLTAFTHLEVGRVILIDLAVAMTQLSALGWLGLSGRMSAVSACAALGGASAIPVVGWLYCARVEIAVGIRQVPTILKQTWAVGKWLLVGQIAVQVQRHIIYWVAMLVAGAAITGVYAACMSIVSFLSPLIFALSNVLTPKLQLAWKNGGGPGLWHEAVRNTVLTASLILPLCLAVLVIGETVMRFLFPGTEYEGHRYILTILALVMFFEALSMPASIALAVMERLRAIVMAGMVGAALTVILVWPLMRQWGLLGAACGSLGGAATVAIGVWVMLYLRSKGYDPIFVMHALQNFTRSADTSPWKITRLGEGLHAETFLMQSNSALTCPSLVAKLYKPWKAFTLQMVQAQFDALSNLHTVLHEREINGWKVSIPRPLFIHKSPVALVMTEVPGRHIDFYASKNDVLTSRNLRVAARALVTVIQQYWSGGRCHGDLGVHNVLFDIEAKKISFIDPGTFESCPICNDCTRSQTPAASDLAHTLFDVTCDFMDLIGNQTMRAHRETFVEYVLHRIIENIDSPEEQQRLLNEVRSSVQQHLDDGWKTSWCPKGMWHSFIKDVQFQRISSIIERVVSRINVFSMAE